jgi:hypothetical protein
MIAERFAFAERVADAVMYEGYILYPYRASAIKNQFRWQFGLVAPRAYAEQTTGEAWCAQTECLVEAAPQSRVTLKVRCLQLQPSHHGDWEEASVQVPVHVDCLIDDVLARERTTPFTLSGVEQISGVVHVSAEHRRTLVKLRVRVENLSTWPPASAGPTAPLDRNEALRHTLIAVHSLLHLENGSFISLLDPPPHASEAVASCRNERTWPVLAGPPGSNDMMLSLPIILYDHPAIAPESSGDYFDATEIDELLALRIMTLTDAEKLEAAGTDPRARKIVDRATRLGPDQLAKLHGAVRSFGDLRADLAGWETILNPPGDLPPEDAVLDIGTIRVTRGSRVRLAPNRRADSMDMFLAGRMATIAGIHRDLEDRAYVAVTIDDDPGADLRRSYGRFFYFSSSEVVPVIAERTNDAL